MATECSAPPLFGLMQDWPLTTDKVIDHAARWHGHREVVSRRPDGSLGRATYAQVRRDANRLSNALLARGVQPGDRVATLAMNGVEHLAAWYAISGIGAVCHTLNPRLFDEQLVFIANHAENRLVLADAAFAPILDRILPRCPTVERVILLSAPSERPTLPVPWETYDEALDGMSDACAWGGFDERTAAGLCYTSGTTGDPKGVLYSHRSNMLHTFMTLQVDVFGFGVRDVVLPMVPMYHANAWGIAFAAPAVGARLVMPGAALDGASLHALFEAEQVTIAAGVPTVWIGLVQHLQAAGLRVPSLKRAIVGGAACPERLIRDLRELGVEPTHLWGMTEMSPVGTAAALTPEIAVKDFDAQMPWRVRQGRPPLGVDLRLVGEDGEEIPRDGRASGALRVRGPAVASAYYRRPADAMVDAQGGFDTGDIATVEDQGFMQITDRAKDIIKSGGEWISSIEVENAALMHPAAALAAVIGEPHDRWGERPVLYVQLKPDRNATAEQFQALLKKSVASWWVPERVVFIEQIPVGATGKVDKKRLRADVARL
jgi:fatty-acyl-CoA synthase